MIYDDKSRGKIQNRERARQIIDFSGIRYGRITPTDIDGYFEYHDKAFVFYEYKLVGGECPRGQKIALERLADAVTDSGKEAVIFLCRHAVEDTRKDISASNSIVESVYYRGKWKNGDGRTVKQYTDSFMNWVGE